MILGTVEIGLAYGINNHCGKPNNIQAYDILKTAWNGGIRELDTAAGYGESESIIGRFQIEHKVKFSIDTKLPVSLEQDQYKSQFDVSCRKLSVDKINTLYLHSFEQCKNSSILEFLKDLKDMDKIRNIGISIYEPEELEYIIDNLPIVDTIQFPFNIFDNYRWKANGLLSRAKKANKILNVRSVFLQGLIFKSVDDEFVRQLGISSYIEKINKLCKRVGISVQKLAYKYVSNFTEIDNIILGCQNSDEVKENLNIEKSSYKISEKLIAELEYDMLNIPIVAIDPRRWNNK